MSRRKSRRGFLWYYSVIVMSFGCLVNFIDWWTLDDAESSFWAVVLSVPVIVLIVKEIE